MVYIVPVGLKPIITFRQIIHMDRTFKVSVGMKVFYFILGIAAIVFSLFLLTVSTTAPAAIMILPILVFFGGVLTILTQVRRQIIVSTDSITKIGVFKTTEIALQDIKGVRVGDKAIAIELNLIPATKINIGNYSDYSGSEELTKYLLTNFVDLNDVDYQTELKNILSDTDLGLTEEDRKAKLKKAQYLAWSYNGGAGICFALGLFWNNPVSMIILLIYPLLALPIILTSKRLIRMLPKYKSPYYTVFVGVMFPVIISIIIATQKYDILYFKSLWVYIISVIVVLGAAFYLADKDNVIVPVSGRIFATCMLSVLYGFGGIMNINCAFDKSAEQVYRAEVLDHNISHGKSTTYYLMLGPWGPQANTDQVAVSSSRYYRTNIGSKVTVHLKKGLLNAPWFTIGD